MLIVAYATVLLSVLMPNAFYAEYCIYICHTDCHYSECHCDECRGAPKPMHQGTHTEREGSVQLTSSLKYLVLKKRKEIFSVLKEADLN